MKREKREKENGGSVEQRRCGGASVDWHNNGSLVDQGVHTAHTRLHFVMHARAKRVL